MVRAPGWVTAVSLCCFCNVALILATMKTFILQQVKCRHLSYSDLSDKTHLIFILSPFHSTTPPFISRHRHYFPPSASSFTLISEITPSLWCGGWGWGPYLEK